MSAQRRSVPAPWLETLRLEMRDFTAEDSDDLFRLNSDPRVMRFIGDGKPADAARHADIMRRVLRYPRLYPDLGFWYTTRRDTGAFVGWFTLKYCGKSADVETGYMLLPEAWGQGYATEGATRDGALRIRRPRARPHHRRHASGELRVAARAAEGGARRCRLWFLLRAATAAVRGAAG